MNDRIPCLVPGCRRTAPADKYPAGTEIICGKCWRKLPRTMRDHHRRLERRLRRIERAVTRGWLEESWERIRRYYREPDKPAGLDAFLEEMGLE